MVPLSCSQRLRLTLRDMTFDIGVPQGIWSLFNHHIYIHLPWHGLAAWLDALVEPFLYETQLHRNCQSPGSSPLLCKAQKSSAWVPNGLERCWGLSWQRRHCRDTLSSLSLHYSYKCLCTMKCLVRTHRKP